VKTSAVFFPFDLFGSAGAGDGARLLADALAEMLADNRREKKTTRAAAYQSQVRSRELEFETPADYRDWRQRGRSAVRQVLDKGDFLFWVAGNHLGALPLYDELAGSDSSTLVVQFDAHLDVYHLSDCTAELSHGNFLLHCAGPLPRIMNLGHRELLLRPQHVGRTYEWACAASELAIDTETALARLREECRKARRVFLDIDCDVLDPAYFPAVSHPLPFGLGPALFLRLLDAAWSERVAGIALSEFDPARDRDDRSLATLVWLLEYLLLKRYEGTGPRLTKTRRRAPRRRPWA
jgi:arginase family enzyme